MLRVSGEAREKEARLASKSGISLNTECLQNLFSVNATRALRFLALTL